MSGQHLDDPNREAVGLEPAWAEGYGGDGAGPAAAEAEPKAEPSLDEMTKDQLLEYAREQEISPANASMSKDEIRESIDEAEGR